ncbi:uncharacterized protein BCR38DRAFT_474038 [Pseudomassariella vexata]|uniref:Uncharacterized protein n=1 Tax=Pseudomassariella vexata TaxID=1141098 RepID=A0A1Y2E2G8_9PEZI|nr:uncharacterized protein BCR38DRAFT_474038 [Pseudomassariella vexata]ORY65065.1 hypothetical protein BCR38DRAFT_474038 [Pseudomassariella vexata]
MIVPVFEDFAIGIRGPPSSDKTQLANQLTAVLRQLVTNDVLVSLGCYAVASGVVSKMLDRDNVDAHHVEKVLEWLNDRPRGSFNHPCDLLLDPDCTQWELDGSAVAEVARMIKLRVEAAFHFRASQTIDGPYIKKNSPWPGIQKLVCRFKIVEGFLILANQNGTKQTRGVPELYQRRFAQA